MQLPPTPSIKSQPIYISVAINPTVEHHLFIAEQGSEDELNPLYDYCKSAQKTLIVIERNLSEPTTESIDSEQKQLILDKIASLPVSSNIYLSGMTESFLWDIHNLAIEAGMTEQQIQKIAPITHKRRLFCTHCYTITENVTYTPFECPSCQRLLLVRDHFSRLHAAYVGVMINAEDPTEIPDSEELRK